MTSYGVIFKRFDRDLISCEDSTSETSLHVHRSARVVALYAEASVTPQSRNASFVIPLPVSPTYDNIGCNSSSPKRTE